MNFTLIWNKIPTVESGLKIADVQFFRFCSRLHSEETCRSMQRIKTHFIVRWHNNVTGKTFYILKGKNHWECSKNVECHATVSALNTQFLFLWFSKRSNVVRACDKWMPVMVMKLYHTAFFHEYCTVCHG